MELKMPTQDQVLEAYHYIDNEELEFFLKKLWPQAFEDGKFVKLDPNSPIRTRGTGITMAWVSLEHEGKEIVFNPDFDWEFVKKDGNIKAIPTRKVHKEKSARERRIER